MAKDAALLEVFDTLVESAELVIQWAQEAQDPGLINQETAELHKRFAAYKTALAQMTNQGSEMVSLPQGVKLEKPKSFTGVIDTDTVNIFIIQVELYSFMTKMVDAN